LRLSLEQAVKIAVINNLRLQSARLSVDTARFGVPTAEAAFHPTLTLNASRTGTETSVRTAPDHTKTTLSSTFGPSITNKFLTGTSVTLTQTNTRPDSTPEEGTKTSGLTITVSQPLLKGAGIEVNRATIDTAKNNVLLAVRDLESRLIETLANVENAYLDLLLAVEDRKIRELGLERARQQLEVNRFLIQLGRLASRELAAAEAAVSSAEVDVAVARNAIENARRALLRLLNQEPVEVILVDPLTSTPARVNPAAALETAMRRRPDLLRARISVENAKINVSTARNNALYDLNLNASLGSTGSTPDPLSKAVQRSSDFKDVTWTIGATLTIPLDNTPNRNAYLSALNALRQSELDLKDAEQGARLDLDNAMKNLDINVRRLNEAERAQTLAQDRLETETMKFREGRATNADIINARRDLVSAQNALLQAIVSYQKSRVAFEQTQGITLDRWGIEVK
jgi:outer membrane protein TolC